jgi:hypothetical protein
MSYMMNKNSKNSTKVIVSNAINGDFAVTANGDKFSFQLGGNIRTGDFNVSLDIEEGQIAYNGTKEGGEQIRQFVEEQNAQKKEEWAETKQELKTVMSLIPFGLEAIRNEIDKMDDWDDQRSERRAKKRGMAYIRQADLEELLQELNELREARGEKTTEDENKEEFEDVK